MHGQTAHMHVLCKIIILLPFFLLYLQVSLPAVTVAVALVQNVSFVQTNNTQTPRPFKTCPQKPYKYNGLGITAE